MIFWALLILAVPFVLPVLSLVLQGRLRIRVTALEELVARQQRTIDELERRLRERPKPAQPPQVVQPPAQPVAPTVAPPPAPAVSPPPAPVTPPPVVPAPTPAVSPPPVPVMPPPVVPAPAPIVTPRPEPTVTTTGSPESRAAASAMPAPFPPRVPPPPPAPPGETPAFAPFDWESVVGVKLFSAVAGIALVLAAVFFLRYSIDQGWLGPPVRVAIGIIVGVALLVVCERKAARQYPATANALDAAAIAILFATFFSAHALWQLVPAAAAFALLALVTAVAVLLSIRRDSLFIAVLGLVGGFATPALLSTGENRPVPLFAYLLLLNAGLAWVASRKKWPVLTVLTLVFTAIYQWGWVHRFLSASQLSLAMGIFLVFSIASFIALTASRRAGGGSPADVALDRVGLGASAMPLVFAVYLAAVPAYGAHVGLLFGFLVLLDTGLFGIAVARSHEPLHAIGGVTTLLVFAIWLAVSYVSSAWITATAFAALLVVFYALAPIGATRLGRPFSGIGSRAVYAAPMLLFVFPVIARIEPAVESPLVLFGTLFVLLAVIAWRALASEEAGLYFVAAFFALAAEASWSAAHLTIDRLGAASALYLGFGVFYLGVPIAARHVGRRLEPRGAPGALLLASLALLLFLASGLHAAAAIWGLALLLAILNAGLFIESAAGGLPWVSAAGGALSWLVLAVWWRNAAAIVGLLPSLLVVVGLTLVMLAGHAWAHAQRPLVEQSDRTARLGFQHGIYLGLVGHFFLFFIAQTPAWSTPPWPMLGSLAVLTLAVSAASLAVQASELHAAGVIAAAVVTLAWAHVTLQGAWAMVALVSIEVLVAYSLGWLSIARGARKATTIAAIGATAVLFIAELTVIDLAAVSGAPPLAIVTSAHVINLSLILALAWNRRWPYVAPAAVAPAWLAVASWQAYHPQAAAWKGTLAMATALYAMFVAYPFVLHRRARDSRDPYLTAVAASAFFFFTARAAILQGGQTSIVGIVPVIEAAILALLLRQLLGIQAPGARDVGRLALVAASALAFVTVAIPLQLSHQWITIGWALEGAALAWLYRRMPHRGLLYGSAALLAVVFVRLALNQAVFVYEPRGMRVLNWYLYTYLVCSLALLVAAWWLSATADRLTATGPRMSSLLPAGGVILLFLLLNIEIADFYATGPEITFKFGVTIAQDLTYTIGWLVFGLGLLTAGIYLHNRPGRVTAVALIAVTAFKAFLYDMGSLGGLYRVASLVGLAVSLALVALALQKFVLQPPKEAS